MNQEVLDFIKLKDQEYAALKAEEKRAFMDKAGIWKKVFEDADDQAANGEKQEYPYGEYDGDKWKRYRRVYPELTEEEFAAMKQAQDRVDEAKHDEKEEKSSGSSGLATFLKVLAFVLFIGAFIAGIALANKEVSVGTYYTHTEKKFDLGTAIIYWGIGLFSGSVMLGFASIVENLNHQTQLLRAVLKKK